MNVNNLFKPVLTNGIICCVSANLLVIALVCVYIQPQQPKILSHTESYGMQPKLPQCSGVFWHDNN